MFVGMLRKHMYLFLIADFEKMSFHQRAEFFFSNKAKNAATFKHNM
jgi:hypothetical protein